MKRREFLTAAAASTAAATAYGILPSQSTATPSQTPQHSVVRVKSVVEQFDDTREPASYAKHGSRQNKLWLSDADKPITLGRAIDNSEEPRQLFTLSDRTHAIAGAWLLHMVNNECQRTDTPVSESFKMGDVDRQLVEYAVNNCKFSGSIPCELEDCLMFKPLLESSATPYVRMATVGSNRKSKRLPSMHEMTACIEVGLNFFPTGDPVATGKMISGAFAGALQREIDACVFNGNGKNGPVGITKTPGVKAVRSENGPAGPPTKRDYEQLLSASRYLSAAGEREGVFVGTEMGYLRARAATELAGRKHGEVLGRRFAMSEAVGNWCVSYCDLNRYLLIRKRGCEVQLLGDLLPLARKCRQLILVRHHFGGGLTDGMAAAVCNDMQD